MGILASAVTSANGRVLGIMPRAFHAAGKVDHAHVEQITCDTMHERKQMFVEKSDAFIAVPGGLGTMEELIECTTWVTLNIHQKPVRLQINGGALIC
jgi:uncharacterized protein (TIGR00730 family)